MRKLPRKVHIREVGPRDGLQNERNLIATKDKITWIEKLTNTGLSYVEITSFVSPKWVPALWDSKILAEKLKRKEGVTYAALVPNSRGAENAIAAGVDELSVFMSASDSHNRKNINKSISETYPVLKKGIEVGKKAGKTVRGYISTAFSCPYEGRVEPAIVIEVANNFLEMGVDELSIGDTMGTASPRQVQELLSLLLKNIPKNKIAMHFHDTYGMAAANCLASLQLGISKFDSSCGGLGGCPYAPGASGNMATEDLLYMLHGMNIETGVQENSILEAAAFIEKKLQRPLQGKVYTASRARG